MDDQTPEPSFDLPGLAPAPADAPAGGYRVLARKYRPRNFDQLYGQEAMVRTLKNAFASGRIPQAWMLTGVRGVGKTTTARILARALNYETPDNKNAGPTIELATLGVHCRKIIDGEHMDVFEVDAASNTGVDFIRQINDQVRYKPMEARYKVYIIDEVHMLSTAAFNAFLKTLEEPPPHAKFIFATTEIKKVPVTILSRCQRFDLKRIDAATLVEMLRNICANEKVEVEDEALAIIARAAEGSARDSQSLLDQAISHGDGKVTADAVRQMMGLADRGRVIDLFEAAMRGDLPAALGLLRELWDGGADPAVVLTDLAEFSHLVTRIKVVPATAKDASLTEAERTRGRDFATRLSMRVLSRAWSMLTKAITETQGSPRPLASAEMALVRLAHAADLPTPDDVIRMFRDGAPSSSPPSSGGNGGGRESAAPQARLDPPRPVLAASSNAAPRIEARAAPAPRADLAPRVMLKSLEDVAAFAEKNRDIQLKLAIERDVRLVRFEQGRIEFALAEGGSQSLPNDLSRKLQEWTGERWIVAISLDEGEMTIRERKRAAEQEKLTGVRAEPLVRAIMDLYPGAQIVAIRDAESVEAAPPPPVERDPESDDESDPDFDAVGDYSDDDL
ncbi:DNA polymerase III subunit gamma/tau [Terrarubrum flagellatum]|uniref:DNA polymerase III subunit gamma/tau n=1 Tax=Terrirubrum flagellatum TaxID=2895980 RepID=UPI0031455A06